MNALPRLDPYLAGLGEELEDLSRIGGAQPFRATGPALSRANLAALAGTDPGSTPALVAAGLADAAGLTGDGRAVAALLGGATSRVRVESGRGRAPLTLDVYLRSGLALAVATASPAALPDAPRGDDLLAAAGTVALDLLDSAAVPAHVASWVGVSPAWSLATSPAELLEETVLQRVDVPDLPPPREADAHLRHAWAQPWYLWSARSSEAAEGLVVVRAGAAGHFALTRSARAGYVGFEPLPSAVLWSRLVGLVGTAARAG